MITLYTAQWVLPMTTTADAITGGAVAVDDALIVGVGSRAEMLARFPRATLQDYGVAAILPGLVNCHTHLELTAMRGYLEPEESNFLAWLKKLTLARMLKLTPDDLFTSAAWGAVEAARAGITCVGDASSSAAESLHALREVGLRGTIYQEVFGPDPSIAGDQLEKLRQQVESLRPLKTDLIRVGVSPHSPYTVSAKLLEMVADYAVAEKLPLMIHTAESGAEELLLRENRGLFARSYQERGIEWLAPCLSSVQYLAACGVLRARPLLAHCVRVDSQDIEMIRERGASVAHCPKSNAKLGHGRAPYRLLRQVNCGFGSDSVASNNTCDILEEARFALLMSRASPPSSAHESEPLNAHEVLTDATLGGARALNYENLIGTLEVGKQADLIAVKLDGTHQSPVYDPTRALIFSSSGQDVRLTVIAGREVFRDNCVTTVDEEHLRARMSEIREKLMTA